MKYADAVELRPKYLKALFGKLTKDSVIKDVYVSYMEPSVAESHFRSFKMGITEGFVQAYEGEYTLWVWLQDDTILKVKDVIFSDKIETLYQDVNELD